MLENPPKEASFDHVDADGNLIFICENTPLRIQVDDTLERAIADSHKITSKNSDEHNSADAGTNSMQSNATLPISQIQALIRAGVTPSHVAQRYNVSETQVRRFSAGVETEKQYAIEQFLLVPAPKQSNMRTIADLIERTLAKAHIGMETVQWKATRRGLEPWRISATFKTATRTIKAEWTWNMHDNSVTCANPSSRLLLGEDVNAADTSKQSPYGGAYRDTVSINFPFNTEELPGNSIRSARIERAVSQWELRNSDKLADAQVQSSLEIQDNSSDIQQVLEKGYSERSTKTNTQFKEDNPQQPSLMQPDVESNNRNETNSKIANESKKAQKSLAAKVQNAEKADIASKTLQENTSESNQNSAKNNQEINTNSQEKSSSEHNKRKAGRAAVPSWDEILFGES
ncbi:septation protein SepH [Gardnerella sp. Marseille-Q9179]|uniref:septation protein SepH n=1 Tax=Gardnerella sp. Marseille-Q9179 TaxID=3383028 RepID=UPI003AF92808